MASLPIPSRPILVVGDIMCDHYVWGDVERISPEAPVQVLRWQREADRPGGAANAAFNLAALGCRVMLVGVIGKDEPGEWLLRTLRASGVDTRGVVRSPKRQTTIKTRVMARGQHMLRIDRETPGQIDPADERRVVAAVRKYRTRAAGVLCSDYSKGVLTDRVLRAALQGRRRLFTVVDPKSRDFARYRGADVLTPNEKELREAVQAGTQPQSHSMEQAAANVIARLRLKALLLTRGAAGMDLFQRVGRRMQRTHIPALQRHEVFDVTGAGDTVAAVLTMGGAAGVPLQDAARIANAAAGIVVGMVGTAATDRDTLTSVIDGQSSQARSKVLSPRALADRIAEARAGGAKTVFANGTFESLGVRDLRALQRARARGDILVVGVAGHGSGALERAELLAALRFVDYVTTYDDRSPLRLIRQLRPDVVV